MAGAPSLATNLAYNPFGNPAPRRRPAEMDIPMRRTDGFSDDGLSYSVINDLDKLTSQALAEFEARSRRPRNDIWGQTLADDRPENLKQTILDPIAQLTGQQAPESDPLRTYKTRGGGVVGVNPRTGESKMLVKDPEVVAPVPSFTQKQKSDLRMIEDDILETRKLFNKAAEIDEKSALQGRLNSLERTRRKIFDIEQPTTAAEVATPIPPVWANWPNAQGGSFLGTPGSANQFSGRVSPFAQTNAAPRRLRFNPQTGKLE